MTHPLLPAYRVVPWFSPRLWGTKDLSSFYPERGAESEPIGEAWLTADRCPVPVNEAAGTLGELVRHHASHLFGSHARFDEFPLLVKFLFPQDRLSVQVHPDDVYAAARGLGRGKTEMWYVVSAQPGARLGVGLRAGCGLPELEAACRSGRGAEVLNWFTVSAGDTIYLPAGAIHAIGPGVVLCEVQQQSDNTFRLDDYGRRDAQGRLRELHLEDGLAVARPELGGRVTTGLGPMESGLLVESPYFRVSRLLLKAGEHHFLPGGVLRVLANFGADARLEIPGESEASSIFRRGHALVIPAGSLGVTLAGPAEVLEATLPGA